LIGDGDPVFLARQNSRHAAVRPAVLEGIAPRYQLDELLADLTLGHNVRATFFADCQSMYRADGPFPMWPVGEVEFVNGVAAMFASGTYGVLHATAEILSQESSSFSL
jgi:hypothetical protein